MIALLCSLAWGGDIIALEPGHTFTATERVFILPEPKYDSCLAKAEALASTADELERSRAAIVEAQVSARAALQRCGIAAATAQEESGRLKEETVVLRNRQTVLLGVGVVLGAVILAESYALIRGAR